MSNVLYFTSRGLNRQRDKIVELEKTLRRLQSQTAHTAEVGGNQYHDNASYEYLLIQIRVADRRLAEAMAALNRVVVLPLPKFPEWVQLGTRVRLLVNGEPKILSIVGYGESAIEEGKISYEAPLAQALIGAYPGDIRTITIDGENITYLIEAVEALEEANQ